MTFADARLLRDFAQLMLEVAAARDPVARMGVSVNLNATKGYRDLRAWFVGLSPRAREDARRLLRMQIQGAREVQRLTGKVPDLGDLTIEIRDAETSVPVASSCPGSGRGIAAPIDDQIQCSCCAARWGVHDIGFKIPDHSKEPQ